jgi:peptide-methionine (S)-S-oxide reductase
MTGAALPATFGSGCFWCTEAVFQEVNGILSVESGYSGGQTENPTYESICTGKTGHAECVRLRFDPRVISYHDLLAVFFKTHDPTTLNQQGADRGTQYRSVIFTHNDQQRQQANEYVKELDDAGVYPNPVVTQVCDATTFYPAEKYHHNYYRTHQNQPYCQAVIAPKLAKFQADFRDRL